MKLETTLKEVKKFGILPYQQLYKKAKKEDINEISSLAIIKNNFENNFTEYINYDKEFFINKKRKLNFYDLENIDNIMQATLNNYKKLYL